jgi:hypothetical protein
VPTFENGWICRECWCANRESDARCYRCHAPQEGIQVVPAGAMATAKPADEAEDAGVTNAASTPGISYCMTCGEVMDADARICSQCGTPAEEAEPAVTATAEPQAPAPARAPRAPRVAVLPRLRESYVAFIDAHQIEWEESMSVLAVASTLIGLAADRINGSLANVLATAAWLMTAVFVAEFGSRLAAAHDRRSHLLGHLVDLIALVPVLRLARVLRLLWMLVLAPVVARIQAAIARVAASVRRVRGRVAEVRASVGKVGRREQVQGSTMGSTTGRTTKAAPQLRSHRSLSWLVPAWAAAAVSSALFLLTTQRGQIMASLLVLVSLGLFSAITAAITTISMDRRGRTASELPEQTLERLQELDQLRDAGLVTPAEHTARRAELLRNPAPQ